MWRLMSMLIAIGLLAISASTAIATTGHAPADEYEYTYFDDYSTDRVITDSYEHSVICDGPCYCLYGAVLGLLSSPLLPEPGLCFLGCFETPGAPAYLRYQFPLLPITGTITGGAIGFEVDGYYGVPVELDLRVSYDGANWELLESITTPGYHEYPFTPSDSTQQVFVELEGSSLVLYSLSIQLNMTDVVFICGDVNGDWEGPNMADVTYFVDYLFRGGPPPLVMETADVDGLNGINVADLTYLVAYLFDSGPAPACS